ncbi:MAG TPA: helix-hairpin-helix domain-containing protein [Dongiaceae bacterium]|nr:helix-hairpin-helix domain-containing protein [Dongiaceae bacterium]
MPMNTSASRWDGTIKNLNTASKEQLRQAAHIGEDSLDEFLKKRREKGGFTGWQQVKDDVPSFDDATIQRLKEAGFEFGRTDMLAAA